MADFDKIQMKKDFSFLISVVADPSVAFHYFCVKASWKLEQIQYKLKGLIE